MSMDVLPVLHPDLQRIIDEQQPMSMDVLPTLHPYLQRAIDKQLASSMLTPQPVDMLELLPPPPQFCWSRASFTRQRRCCWDCRLNRPLQHPLRRLLHHQNSHLLCRLHQL
jgi:hypothetical protein